MRRTMIGVMGSGLEGGNLEDTAFTLGTLIAREGWILLTGGRRSGVMDAANRGAKTVPGSTTVGILPTDHRTTDVSDAVDIAVFTNMGDARNAINAQSSDVLIACGAETPGTLSEVALALKSNKHVVLLGAGNEARGFLTRCGGDRVHVATDPAEAIAQIRQLGFGSDPS
jgi:uncharacterized protein (TIGR00725 family)